MCGSLFGGGSVKTPEIQKVDPAVNRQGFAATTLATQAQGKNTLG